jgi:uncharacterized protein (DUF305 family)
MRRFRPGAALVVGFLAVVLLGMVFLGMACVSCAEQPAASSRAVVRTAFGGTDTAWTQLMIPMTAQAVTILELTANRASDAGLAGLATELGADYRGELLRLRTALTRAGLAETKEHEGHELPGMITDADLRIIGQRTGADFDALVVQHLREEMQQSVRLARSEQQAGQNGDCKAIAASIEKARTASLDRLDAVTGP